MKVAQLEGRVVTTIEGVAPVGTLHPLQEAFVEHGAVQCGFCTPGIVLAALALLARNPRPDRHTIREGLSGNLCRCTGYQKIVDAVEAAAEVMTGEHAMKVYLPGSLDELWDRCAAHPDAAFFAGGTDIFVKWRAGSRPPECALGL